MDILIITPDIYPFQKGYGGRNPLNIFDSLRDMGNNVYLLTSLPDKHLDSLSTYKKPEQFKIARLHSFKKIPSDYDYIMPLYFKDFMEIKKLFSIKDFDMIILNDVFWSLSLASIISMKKVDRKKILIIDNGIYSPKSPPIKYFMNVFYNVFFKIFLSQVKGVLSYSMESYNRIEKFLTPGIKHKIRPSCIDSFSFLKDYNDSLKNSEKYYEMNPYKNKKFIFSIGAASPHKGYIILLDAFKILLNEFPEIELIIAGQVTEYSNELLNHAKSLGIESKIKLIGPISEKEKFFYLLNCELFVIPSLIEGFGAGAMEADVLQIKLVATGTGAHKEILNGNKFSKIIEPGNVSELHMALSSMLSSKIDAPRKLDIKKLEKYSCSELCRFIISFKND
jgi:glycosyltransferase involved in cell wall biosynthesis